MKRICCIYKPLALFLLLLSVDAAEPTPSEPQSPQPTGELVDVGGYRVHLYCTGQGNPPVVVASGGFSFDWGLVQPEVARDTRICAYDPSGTAWRDRVKPGNEITCGDRVSELHRLLKAARVDGPYVMVGFSVGGLARLYATRYPSEIAGMVIVDHAFIDADGDRDTAKPQPQQRTDVDSMPVLISKTPIALDLEDDRNFERLPARDQELHRWALSIHSDRPTPKMAARCFSEAGSNGYTG